MPHSILHLIDTGGPGGAETVFHNIVTGLDARRWDSIAVVPVRDWLYDALQKSGVTPVLCGTHGSFDFSYLRRLVGLARSGPSLIHAHLFTSSVYGAMAGMLTGVPVVCTFHGEVDIRDQARLRNLKFRLINNGARARTVFVSDALRRSFQSLVALNTSRSRVIHNGIDAASFHPAADDSLRRALDVREGELLIGAVGNVRSSKGYDILLRAIAELRDRTRDCRFVIVGQASGPLHEQLKALHAELDLGDTVHFTGFLDDIPRVMRNLDIYVSSSTAEGFSLTTVEAMACGVPVVATRSGGPEEIIEDGVTGVLVPAASVAALANGIHALVQDPARRRELADAGRKAATTRFSIDAMLRGYETLYDDCLGAGAGVANAPDPDRLPVAQQR